MSREVRAGQLKIFSFKKALFAAATLAALLSTGLLKSNLAWADAMQQQFIVVFSAEIEDTSSTQKMLQDCLGRAHSITVKRANNLKQWIITTKPKLTDEQATDFIQRLRQNPHIKWAELDRPMAITPPPQNSLKN